MCSYSFIEYKYIQDLSSYMLSQKLTDIHIPSFFLFLYLIFLNIDFHFISNANDIEKNIIKKKKTDLTIIFS